MKKNNSTKTNTKKIQQSLNLKQANFVKISINNLKEGKNKVDNKNELPTLIQNSLLFKIYLKSVLLNKTLSINSRHEFQIFNKSNSCIILNAFAFNEEKEKIEIIDEEFIINEQTTIEYDEIRIEKLDDSNLLNNVTAELNRLNIGNNDDFNDQNILKYLIENKSNYLFRSGNNKSPNKLKLIGCEEQYTKILNLFKLFLQGDLTQFTITNSIPEYILYKGILISGPPGVGKSHLLEYIYSQHNEKINFLEIDIYNDFILKENNDEEKQRETPENKIKNIFKFAKILAPSVIVFEELDRIFNKENEDENTITSNSISSNSPIQLNDEKTKLQILFLKEIDELKYSDKVVVIGTCTNIDRLSSDMRKFGRFDCVINLNTPNLNQRREYFNNFSQDFHNNLTDEDNEILSEKSHGFVAGDILQVFKEAIINSTFHIRNSDSVELILTRVDLESALKNVKPINLKDIILDIPKVLWDDIGGNKDIIRKIRQSIEWPLKNADAFKRIGISPPNGILLYGPPGCSKTMIAKALATESGLNFFAVKGPELFSKYVGDTEKAVRDIFKKAKISSPSIIFFDEIDSMATQRGSDSAVSDKVLCQLLNEMDGIESREKLIIFGATNRPDILDKALIRPGRFDRLIYIPPPDDEARREIFKINLQKMSIDDNVSIDKLIEMTNGFSGAEINLICREAGMIALDNDINALKITQADLIQALKYIKPVITKEMINYFENFSKKIEL